jgi:hypothetical protein
MTDMLINEIETSLVTYTSIASLVFLLMKRAEYSSNLYTGRDKKEYVLFNLRAMIHLQTDIVKKHTLFVIVNNMIPSIIDQYHRIDTGSIKISKKKSYRKRLFSIVKTFQKQTKRRLKLAYNRHRGRGIRKNTNN